MLRITARAGDAGALEAYYSQLSKETAPGCGPEDYYAAEARGTWMGGAAQSLGLEGEQVRRGDFLRAASGILPDDSDHVQNAGAENRRAGYDFTFSAPKSVSVAYALGDDARRAEIDQAMAEATRAALDYAERHAAIVRYGKGSIYQQRAQVLASVYTHHTNRNLDPQLHCHAFVHNLAIGEDGKARTLEIKPAYQWQRAIGAAFRVELARQMAELGYTVDRDADAFRLREVDPRLEAEFSTRRAEALAWLRERGLPETEVNMERAVLSTRAAKEVRDPSELLADWRERAERVAELSPVEAPEIQDAQETARAELDSLDESLTEREAVYTEAQAAARIMVAQQGAGSVATGEDATRDYLDGEAVKLAGGYYTTPEQIARERDLLARSDTLAGRDAHRLDADQIGAALSRAEGLSAEQSKAVRATLDGGDLALIQGAAGAGKTTSLRAVVDAYREAGYEVRGLAPSGKAAKVLADSTGIETQTTARAILDRFGGEVPAEDGTRQHIEPKPEASAAWGPGSVVVVDEAGMLNTREAARVLQAAQEGGAKVVLVGDAKQLQAVEAGGPFRQLQDRHGVAHIETARRQQSAEDRRMVQQVRDGDAAGAFKTLADNERLHITRSGREAKAQIARDLVADRDAGRTSYALAQRRLDAKDINDNTREQLKARGELAGGVEAATKYRDSDGQTRTSRREFAPGDRVILLQNVNSRKDQAAMGGEVKNGYTGTLESVERGREPDSARLSVRLEDGTRRDFDTADYGHLDHAYALTTYKSQGSTYDATRVYAAAEDFGAREAGYVAVSRARGETHLYGDREALADTAESWQGEAQKRNALDFALGGQGDASERATAEQRAETREVVNRTLDQVAERQAEAEREALEREEARRAVETIPTQSADLAFFEL